MSKQFHKIITESDRDQPFTRKRFAVALEGTIKSMGMNPRTVPPAVKGKIMEDLRNNLDLTGDMKTHALRNSATAKTPSDFGIDATPVRTILRVKEALDRFRRGKILVEIITKVSDAPFRMPAMNGTTPYSYAYSVHALLALPEAITIQGILEPEKPIAVIGRVKEPSAGMMDSLKRTIRNVFGTSLYHIVYFLPNPGEEIATLQELGVPLKKM